MSDISLQTWGLSLGLAGGLILVHRLWSGSRSQLPLPPGPKKLPILGNLLDIPSKDPWETYAKWAKDYGSDVLHISIAGQSMILLSSLKATQDLLDKRSSTYSDRQMNEGSPMLALCGWDFAFVLWKYGEPWRTHRRMMKEGFGSPQAVVKYQPKQVLAAHRLLYRLLHTPQDFYSHFAYWGGDNALSAIYGIDVQPTNDPFVEKALHGVDSFAVAGSPGAFLVDALPFLRFVPEWFPGAGFQKTAREIKAMVTEMKDKPFAETKRRISNGTASSSFATDCLESAKERDYTEKMVSDAAATIMLGGTETTVSTMASLLLAMMANPEAQRKAQAEIDAVVGKDSLPTFEHESELPYVAAVLKEMLRWNPAGPIALPHYTEQEDNYNGYRIPAKSMILGNSWGILHDEKTYPDPFSFKPERWLTADGKLNPNAVDPDIGFGYGRRECPGRHFAKTLLWVATASILAAFTVEKARDENGNVIEPTYEYNSGIINSPLPFKCSIKPRSQAIERTIRSFDS
ncbi:cytochrome P450 [Roridomyces roridus]|uniref:Cytochrome P450 n=1 Tax=Roridomyces roridus TaxID=1738132 RepID=A0AAD7BM80_9AGAR|nr:cytochrome P450 [Roridomyces roridus]